MDHSHLLSIDRTRHDWNLKVRVTRIWLTLSKTGAPVRYNLILLDCLHSHIHAVVPLSLWPRFENLLAESRLYRVSNFHVLPSAGFFKPVHFPLSITFNASTVVNEVPLDDSMILMHKFRFTDFDDLYQEALQNDEQHRAAYATDVIGVLDNLERVQTMQTSVGVKQMLRFTISDGRHIFDVCFWNPLNFNYEELYGNHVDLPVIVILAGIRLILKDGVVTISNLDCTKVYVNLGHQEVFEMRQRVINSPFIMSLYHPNSAMYHKIKSLDKSDTYWRIRVRITRMWPSISIDGDVLHGFNLILLDVQEHHIHAFIDSKLWTMFNKLLLEGKVYEIFDFWVKESMGTLRPVSNNLCIYFKDTTRVKRIMVDSHSIPMHKFDLMDSTQIYQHGKWDAHSRRLDDPIDVVGFVEDLRPVQCVRTSSGYNRFICFTISDERHKMNVTFWNEHISSLYPLIDHEVITPAIVILASIKASMTEGVIELNTMQCTRIYFNIEHDAVRSLRFWLCANQTV